MKATRELIVAYDGELLYAQPARYDTLSEYLTQFGAMISGISDVAQFRDPIAPDQLILVLLEEEEDPPIDSIADGVARAVFDVIKVLRAEEILEAVSRGVERGMRKGR